MKITNTGTNVSQQLVTNGSGYFEAPLLIAGAYEVSVEIPNFKSFRQTGIQLAVGQSIPLTITLDVGNLSERVDVVAAAVLLDTNAVSSGLTFENRLITELPTFSSMPLLLIRNVSGVAASAAPQFATQGFVGGPSAQAGPIGGVGATEYTIDGATNAGNARNIATSPNSDMLQEMRIETSNFDASVGHGTGLGVAMMTKAGTNRLSGLAGYQAWTSRLNGANHFQKPILDADPELKKVFQSGKSTNMSYTLGGPIVIPKLVDGRNKLFFFANYSFVADLIPGNIQGGAITIPTEAHLRGDFSDLLLLPNPQQYRIYDPLTARPDPNRPGRIIRDPFPNNIIPPNRIVNPAYQLYIQFLPAPNQNPGLRAWRRPTITSARPSPIRRTATSGADASISTPRNRTASSSAPRAVTSPKRTTTGRTRIRSRRACTRRGVCERAGRTPATGRGSSATARSSTLQAASNWFLDSERRLGMKRYTPTDFGMPQYVDDFCSARQGGCQMPAVNIAGYQGFGGNVGLYPEVLNIQGQVNVTHVKGRAHAAVRLGQPQPRPQDLEPRQHVWRGELHQPLHARGRRHDGVPGRKPRALVGRVHARRAAVVFDRRFRGARTPLAVFLGLRPGHVAGRPEPDAQLRPSLRVRERYRRNRAAATSSVGIQTRSPPSRRWPKRPTRQARIRTARRARSRCAAGRFSRAIRERTDAPGRESRCGCRACRAPTGSAAGRCSRPATACSTTR